MRGYGYSLTDAADFVSGALDRGAPVALGLECPLAVPIPQTEGDLLRARAGELDRSFSASAGAVALTQGAVELIWILLRLRRGAPRAATTSPSRWRSDCPLLLWEAFVSGSTAKARAQELTGTYGPHAADVLVAARDFVARGQTIYERSDVRCSPHESHNLAAAAARRASLQINEDELGREVFVVRS